MCGHFRKTFTRSHLKTQNYENNYSCVFNTALCRTLNSFFQMKRFGRRPKEAWIDIFTIRGSFLMINFYSFSTIKFLSNSTNNVPLLWLHFSCLPNTAVRVCSNCSLLTKCRLTHFSFSLQKKIINCIHGTMYILFIPRNIRNRAQW